MLSKTFFAAIFCMLMAVSSLQSQEFYGPCIACPEQGGRCSPCGIAYQEGVSTSMLLTTVLIGSAAVAVVAIALVNTPCKKRHHHHHGHGHGRHSNHRNHCGH